MSLILCERPIENSTRFNKIALRSNSTIYFFSVWTEFRQILGAIQSGRDANSSCKMLVFRHAGKTSDQNRFLPRCKPGISLALGKSYMNLESNNSYLHNF